MLPHRLASSSGIRDTSAASSSDAMISVLRNAISNEHDNALRLRLDHAAGTGETLPPAALSDLLDYACQMRRSPDVRRAIIGLPGFDPNAAGTSGRTPLASAVQCEDLGMVRYLLMQGADPVPHVDGPPQAGMRPEILGMLRSAKAINKLFPRGAPPDDVARSELGTAMRNYDLPRVAHLLALEQARHPGQSTFGLWMRAVRERRADIHCAIIATRHPSAIEAAANVIDHSGRSLLHSGMRHSPPSLRAYLKQYPYYSDKRGTGTNNNTLARFSGSGTPIVCRHFVTYWLAQRAAAPDGKYDYATLESPELIAQHVPPSMEEKYLELRAYAAEVHMFDKAQWGQFLMGQFEQMQSSLPAGESTNKQRTLLISTAHAMGVELKLEVRPDGGKQYAALLYDPNATTAHKRATTSDPAVVRQWQFPTFLKRPDAMPPYFPDGSPILTAYVVSDVDAAAAPSDSARQPFAPPGRCLANPVNILEPAVFQALIRNGFDGELWRHKQEIVAHVRSLTPQEAAAFLASADRDGDPALHFAMIDGYDGSVAAFAGILAECELPREILVDLIAARNDNGTPGIYQALYEGNGAVVAQFGRLLSLDGLTASDKMDLLLARDPFGNPAVMIAALRGHDEAVEIFYDLIVEHLDEERQAAVWAAVAQAVRATMGGR